MIAIDYKFATKCVIKSKTWFDIGKLIYLISKGSNEGYKLWLKYSKFDYENFKEHYCYELWLDFDELMPEEYDDDDEIIIPEDYNEVMPSNYFNSKPEQPEDLPEGW